MGLFDAITGGISDIFGGGGGIFGDIEKMMGMGGQGGLFSDIMNMIDGGSSGGQGGGGGGLGEIGQIAGDVLPLLSFL